MKFFPKQTSAKLICFQYVSFTELYDVVRQYALELLFVITLLLSCGSILSSFYLNLFLENDVAHSFPLTLQLLFCSIVELRSVNKRKLLLTLRSSSTRDDYLFV